MAKIYLLMLSFVCTTCTAFDKCAMKGLPASLDTDRLSGLWQVDASDKLFYIDICSTAGISSSVCSTSSAICRVHRNSTVDGVNIGTFSNYPIIKKSNRDYRFGFTLTYVGNQKCKSKANLNVNSSISFSCGKTLGSPEFVEENNCVYYFNWRTSAACVDLVRPSKVEIPCYVYDDEYRKRDLSLLMKRSGAYLVRSKSPNKMYINVCRNIDVYQSPTLYGCGNFSSSCLVSNGSQDGSESVKSVGQPSQLLQYEDGQIKMLYTSSSNVTECGNKQIITTILFKCDYGNKDSRGPVMIEESECQYTIRWVTEYACPMNDLLSHSCQLNTPSGYFDLLPLMKMSSDYQVTSTIPSQAKFKYFLNVCGPTQMNDCGYLVNADNSKTNAGCQVSLKSPNLTYRIGDYNNSVLRFTDGKLSLTYYAGSPCHDGFRRSTIISFNCDRSIEIGSPKFVQEEHCTYLFSWSTRYACEDYANSNYNPLEEGFTSGFTSSLPCAFYDNNTKFQYNMIPLRLPNSKYVITPPQHTFELNICDQAWQSTCNKSQPDLQHPNPSVCDAEFIIGQTYGNDTLIRKNNQLQLQYPPGQHHRFTTLKFKCNMNYDSNNGSITFVKETSNHNYIFDVATPLACGPKPVSCETNDNAGNYYDLSGLYLSGSNWEAVDTRPGESHLIYKINFCGGVNVDHALCPNTSHLGGCQVDSKNKRGFSMGVMVDGPVIKSKGVLVIRYVNGDLCHGRYRRSTRIQLVCSNVQGSLTFVSESKSCEYYFVWTTPSACPVKRSSGNDCQVENPVTHDVYDIRALTNVHNDYKVNLPSKYYTINVCHKLKSNCGISNSGACLHTGQTSKSVGILNKDLVYNDGYLTLTYPNGSDCTGHSGVKLSTVIQFYCDETLQGVGSGPQFYKLENDCVYVFHWNTSVACPIKTVSDCVTVDTSTGYQYDLSSLSKTTGAWEALVTDPGRRFNHFYINVCRTVNNAVAVGCSRSAGVCLMKTGPQGNSTFNLGHVKNGPYVQNGVVFLDYKDGDTCPDGTSRMSSRITFVCKKGTFNAPVYVAESNCKYEFVWIHEAACPVKASIGGNCSAVNPLSGFTFDLNTLHNKSNDYIVNDHKTKHIYHLNICGTTAISSCGNQAGSCQLKQGASNFSFNAGNANKQLYFDDGALYLNYTGGDLCHKKYHRSTIITFLCANQATGQPVFITESSDCIYYFSWPTYLACERQVECVAMKADGTSVDLSSLIKSTGNWQADTTGSQNGTFYINLCRPLNAIPGVHCPPEASICLQKSKHDTPISLGTVYQPPTVKADGSVELSYFHGSPCPTDSSKRLSAKIVFICQAGSNGNPIVSEPPHDCQYIIHWATAAACDNTVVSQNFSTTCSVYDQGLHYNFSLSYLTLPNKNYVVKSGNDVIELNVCSMVNGQSSTSDCANAGVCLHSGGKNTSLGAVNSTTISYFQSALKLQYSQGAPCPSDATAKISSIILFVCDRFTDTNNPKLVRQDNCLYEFVWNTPLACPILAQNCMIEKNGLIYDLSPLSQITGSWPFHDNRGNNYWLNLCRPIVSGPPGCSSNAAVCKRSGNEVAKELGVTATQRLQVTHAGLIVSYIGGFDVCNSSSEAVSVTIYIFCSNGIGRPYFKRFSKNACSYDFFWKSHVACPTKRHAIAEQGCSITPPNSANKAIDFNAFKKASTNWKVTENRNNGDNYVYYLNVCQNLNPPQNVDKCKDCSVCQTKSNGFRRQIGGPNNPNNRKFYINGDIIEMHLPTTSGVCGKDKNKTVETIILFHCESGSLGSPKFFYESGDCKYYFEWATSLVCFSVPSQSHVNGGVIAAIIISVIVACLLLFFIFRRRRKLKQLVLQVAPPGDYSSVPGDERASDRLISASNRTYQSDDEDLLGA